MHCAGLGGLIGKLCLRISYTSMDAKTLLIFRFTRGWSVAFEGLSFVETDFVRGYFYFRRRIVLWD